MVVQLLQLIMENKNTITRYRLFWWYCIGLSHQFKTYRMSEDVDLKISAKRGHFHSLPSPAPKRQARKKDIRKHSSKNYLYGHSPIFFIDGELKNYSHEIIDYMLFSAFRYSAGLQPKPHALRTLHKLWKNLLSLSQVNC